MILDTMQYANGVRYKGVEDCNTLGTSQVQLVEEITSWINSDTRQQIYFLCGPAACGKTAVARTVAQLFDDLKRLGSSYFLPKTDPQNPNPSCFPCNLFRTISIDVADLDHHFRQAVCEVAQTRAVRENNHVLTQFEELVLRPAHKITTSGPLLIVVDGLENCGNKTTRQQLLSALADKAAMLPSTFRILITSQFEADIVNAFKDKEHVMMKTFGNTTLSDRDAEVSFSPMTGCSQDSAPLEDPPPYWAIEEDSKEYHQIYESPRGSIDDHSDPHFSTMPHLRKEKISKAVIMETVKTPCNQAPPVVSGVMFPKSHSLPRDWHHDFHGCHDTQAILYSYHNKLQDVLHSSKQHDCCHRSIPCYSEVHYINQVSV